MKRRSLSTFIIIAAVLWAAAAIALGILLLGGHELPFKFKKQDDLSSPPAGMIPKAMVSVIDVGQGSSLLVKIYGDYIKSILIDAGEPPFADKVCDVIDSAGLSSLDLIVITHPHSDHFGGATEVLRRYSVDELWLPDISEELTPTNAAYYKFLEAADKNGCRVTTKSKAETLKLSKDSSISIVDGFVDMPKDLNDASLCLRIDIGEASFLVTGDGESDLEATLLERNANIDADILIAGHHGSNTSSGQRFLNAVTPTASAISAGRDNDYGHPHPDAVSRLAAFGNIYRTDINGTITFFTDGDKIAVSADNISDLLDAGR